MPSNLIDSFWCCGGTWCLRCDSYLLDQGRKFALLQNCMTLVPKHSSPDVNTLRFHVEPISGRTVESFLKRLRRHYVMPLAWSLSPLNVMRWCQHLPAVVIFERYGLVTDYYFFCHFFAFRGMLAYYLKARNCLYLYHFQ